MKCPCENCLCVPMCQIKKYHIMAECSLIKTYLFYNACSANSRPPKRVLEIEKFLQPTYWECHIRDGSPSLVFICRKINKFKR